MSDVLDFPPNPTVGQIYTSPDGTTWIWNGRQWHAAGGGGGGGPGPGPGDGIPEAPSTGQFYGRSGSLGGQWQPVLRLSGDTMTGPIIGFAGNAQNPSIETAPGSGLYPSAGAVGVAAQGTPVFLFTVTGHACMQPLNMFNQRINTLAAPQANHEAVNLGYLLNTYRPNYTQLPPAVQQVPVSFPYAGKPGAGALLNVPIGMAVDLAAPGPGNIFVFATTGSTGIAVFILNKISNGVITGLASISILPGLPAVANITGPGGSLALRDTMQLVAPAAQDATLSDLGITVLTTRA